MKNVNNIFVYLLVIFTFCYCKEKDQTSKLQQQKGNEKSEIFQVLQAAGTIFGAGLGDKSNVVIAVMAVDHSLTTTLLASTMALYAMGYLSIQIGKTVPYYISNNLVDIVAFLVFIVLGAKLIVDGYRMSEDCSKSAAISKEINENMCDESMALIESSGCSSPEVENQQHFFTNNYIMTALSFIKIFILVFLAGAGDRSQISTIYLSPTYKDPIILCGVIIAQFLLTTAAVSIGNFLSYKVMSKTKTTISGAIFLSLAMVAIYMVYFNHCMVIDNTWLALGRKVSGTSNSSIQNALKKNYLK